MNEFQLRRYYDLNLTQNSWIFILGVFCIVLGTIVIGVTLYLIRIVDSIVSNSSNYCCPGAVGAVLSNFVAVIYLRMNAAASEGLAAFHGRLVETQKLLLGNMLVSRIDDDGKRWKH